MPFYAQKADQQLTLIVTGSSPDVLISDYAAVTLLLCSTSGTCCITDNCNSMSRIEMSFVAMIMSIALALIGVFNGF